MPNLKIAIIKSRYKSSEYQNFTDFFLLIQKGNGNSNMFCKFQHHSMQIFFKKGELMFFKTEKVATTPPSLSDFDALPYPRVRWYSLFFHENDSKRCKRD